MREKNDWLKKIIVIFMAVVMVVSAIGMKDVTAYAVNEAQKETLSAEAEERVEETSEEPTNQMSLEERYKTYGFNVKEMQATMSAKTNSNVRSGPSTDYPVVGKLEEGDIVEVVGQADTGWYLVQYGAAKVFIADSLLKEVTHREEPAPAPTVETPAAVPTPTPAPTPTPTVETPAVVPEPTPAPAAEVEPQAVPEPAPAPTVEVPAPEPAPAPAPEPEPAPAPEVEEPEKSPLGFPIRENKWEYTIDELTVIAVMSCVHQGMSQREMAIAINNYLCDTVTYDDSLTRYSAFDALAYGSAVCQGYANAYQRMMNAVGIPTDYVRGYGRTSNGEVGRHGWNRVLIDGTYYYVDVTWNDSTNSDEYLLISYEEMSKDHYQTELNPKRTM